MIRGVSAGDDLPRREHLVYIFWMTWQDQFIELLREDFDRRRDRNQRYSIRAFARDLGLSAGTLSEVLRAKRVLTLKRATHILERTQVSNVKKRRFAALAGTEVKIPRKSLPKEYDDIMLDWVRHSIFALCELEAFQATIKSLAARLRIPSRKVQSEIDLLVGRGLLTRQVDGSYRRNRDGDWTFNPGPEEKRLYEKNRMELCQKALAEVAETSRLILNMSFHGNEEQLQLFREEIMKVFNRVSAIASGGVSNELYQFSCQLFPVNFSRPRVEKGKVARKGKTSASRPGPAED